MRSLRRIVLPLLLLAAASSCATSRRAGECPETAHLRCLTGKVCAPDRSRGCQVCRCDSPMGPRDTRPPVGDPLGPGRDPMTNPLP